MFKKIIIASFGLLFVLSPAVASTIHGEEFPTEPIYSSYAATNRQDPTVSEKLSEIIAEINNASNNSSKQYGGGLGRKYFSAYVENVVHPALVQTFSDVYQDQLDQENFNLFFDQLLTTLGEERWHIHEQGTLRPLYRNKYDNENDYNNLIKNGYIRFGNARRFGIRMSYVEKYLGLGRYISDPVNKLNFPDWYSKLEQKIDSLFPDSFKLDAEVTIHDLDLGNIKIFLSQFDEIYLEYEDRRQGGFKYEIQFIEKMNNFVFQLNCSFDMQRHEYIDKYGKYFIMCDHNSYSQGYSFPLMASLFHDAFYANDETFKEKLALFFWTISQFFYFLPRTSVNFRMDLTCAS